VPRSKFPPAASRRRGISFGIKGAGLLTSSPHQMHPLTSSEKGLQEGPPKCAAADALASKARRHTSHRRIWPREVDLCVTRRRAPPMYHSVAGRPVNRGRARRWREPRWRRLPPLRWRLDLYYLSPCVRRRRVLILQRWRATIWPRWMVSDVLGLIRPRWADEMSAQAFAPCVISKRAGPDQNWPFEPVSD
jgi:hypothetical protein